jgi:signal transduction histidine kinase
VRERERVCGSFIELIPTLTLIRTVTLTLTQTSLPNSNHNLGIWAIFNCLFILFIAFEHERFSRLCFLQSKQKTADEQQKIQSVMLTQKIEHDSHEMEILSIRSEEQRKRMESEHAQMVSLIGNVAHDLKTPLQSVGIEIESLKAKLLAVTIILRQWFSLLASQVYGEVRVRVSVVRGLGLG